MDALLQGLGWLVALFVMWCVLIFTGAVGES